MDSVSDKTFMPINEQPDSTKQTKMEPKSAGQDKAIQHQNMTASPVNSEGSMLSDSDATNISSANSTLRSDLSGGKQGRTSHKDAIATLDSFLNDVSQMTEKAKLEEVKKQQQAKEPPPPVCNTTANGKSLLRSTPSGEMTRKWLSLPSVVSEEDYCEVESRLQKSLEDIRSIDYDVFSDEETSLSPHERKLKVHTQNKANKVNSSMSSQGSDVMSPHMYGLTHLDHLTKFLEQFEQLQQQNSELSKRVTNLETNYAKQAPAPSENPPSASDTAPRRSSSIFAIPKEKPKKPKIVKSKPPNPIQHHKDKLKGKTKYLASLPFVLAAKSVDNIKLGSSQNFEKSKSKLARQQKAHSYAADDMEVGKLLHVSEQQWRNSSVKSPSSKDAEKRFSYSEQTTNTPVVTVDSPKQLVHEEVITPVVTVTEEATTSNVDDKRPEAKPHTIGVKKVFPLKPTQPQRSKSEERTYRNTKKMTEWGTLQQAFPVPPIESNVDLLNHLELVISGHKPSTKKTGFKRPGRSKKVKNTSPENVYLPPTEVPGFASTFLAAHAMANQLTLALNLSDLELLSTPETDTSTAPTGFSNQPIRIP